MRSWKPSGTRPSDDALIRLETLPQWTGHGQFSLEPTKRILAALGEPQNKVPAIHVTGTNGKGTTCSHVAAMLISSGKSVAQFSSPPLFDVTERLFLNGLPVARDRLEQAVSDIFKISDEQHIELSHFECITAASFLISAEEKLDWMVVEVGVGGRLDSTNVIAHPRICAITSVSLDHTSILGSTEAEIAFEKAHIFRQGVPAIVGKTSLEAKRSIQKIGDVVGAKVEFLGEDFTVSEEGLVQSATRSFDLSLSGRDIRVRHQRENAAVAVKIAWELGLSDLNIMFGLQRSRWPGRLELFRHFVGGITLPVLLDGAHNPAGMDALIDWVKTERKNYRDLYIVLSVLSTKDWSGIKRKLLELSRLFSSTTFILTDSGHSSAVPPDALQESLGEGEIILSPRVALETAINDADENTLILVTGSLHLLGEARSVLTDQPIATFDAL